MEQIINGDTLNETLHKTQKPNLSWAFVFYKNSIITNRNMSIFYNTGLLNQKYSYRNIFCIFRRSLLLNILKNPKVSKIKECNKG